MNSILTVIKFTFRNRFQTKGFLIITLIVAIILSILLHLSDIIDKFSSNAPYPIGIVVTEKSDITSRLAVYYSKKEQPDVSIVAIPDTGSLEANEQAAKDQLAAKKIKGYIVMQTSTAGVFPTAIYKSESFLSPAMKSSLQNALQNTKQEIAVKDAGLTSEQLDKFFAPISFQSLQISTSNGSVKAGKTESQMNMAYALVYILLLLIYTGVIGYGNLVATEITAEKSSRVMEVLISSVSPLKQMFGKIIGICLLGMAQICLFIAVGVVNLLLSPKNSLISSMHLNFNQIPISLLIYFFLFYVMGFLIYATIFASIGSLVSRTEDVAQVIMPVTMLIVAGFMIAVFGLQFPNAPFIVAMSFVPFFTPLIMFLRIGMSDPALWQIWLSIVILGLSILGLGWVAAKIYRTGVLMYGKRPSFKELRKAMRAFRV